MYGVSRIIILIILVLTLNSCATHQVKKDPEEVLNNAITKNNKESVKASYGAITTDSTSDLPYVPIMKQPEVERIWIYTHVTPSYDLVTGHWVFIILNDRQWYIEPNEVGDGFQTTSRIPIPPTTK